MAVGIDPKNAIAFKGYHFSTCSEREVVLGKELGKILGSFGGNNVFFCKFAELEDMVRCFSFMMTTMTMCKVILDDELISSSGGWMMYGI